MDGGHHQEVDPGTYADRAWLYRRAFSPGTEVPRGRIADALHRRTDEVVAVLRAVSTDAKNPSSPAIRRMLESQGIGTAVGHPIDCDVERLVREADDAMYLAKRHTKDDRRPACPAGPPAPGPIRQPLPT